MIRVLVVDDSHIIRNKISQGLDNFKGIEVTGTAADAYEAREKIVALQPDVVTLDLEMPRMDGFSFLEKLMAHYPLPVIVVSSISQAGSASAIRALELGAVDVLSKPNSKEEVPAFLQMLMEKIKIAAQAKIRNHAAPTAQNPVAGAQTLTEGELKHKVLAIGASTGGTEAIAKVLQALPKEIPGTVMVQHMPAYIMPAFAKRLNDLSALEVQEAKNGMTLRPGLALLSPGDKHMVISRNGDNYMIHLKDGPKVFHQRPSVEVLFDSVAKCAGPSAVGVILTGMGADGARALLNMKNQGSYTIAQDEKTSVVFGMPKAAIDLEAATAVLALDKIPQGIIRGFKKLCGAEV
ncbi:MAG: chemotaxis response regulator protein-glutamate methylesterase [candidate division FCPU426 bacterium]